MIRSGSDKAAVLLLLAHMLAAATGSPGDASPAFRHCTAVCQATGCTDAPVGQQRCSPMCPGTAAEPPPLALRLWHWDCAADCRYLCMWQREEARCAQAPPAPVDKYYGKWPFARALGLQEPASVLFSLLNMAAQLRCLRCLMRLARREAGPRRTTDGVGPAAAAAAVARDRHAARACAPLWALHFWLSAATWLASAAFHARDTHATERLDYYCAGALVAFNTFLSLVRTLRLTARLPQAALGTAIGGYYARHVRRMQLHFDYGLHMRVCVAVGVAQGALWLGWALLAAPRAHGGRRWLVTFVALVHGAMLLEVLDFPPWRHVLDAHACWHLCTAPLAYLWYRFVALDCVYGGGAGGPATKQGT